jgi:hypothetical protein
MLTTRKAVIIGIATVLVACGTTQKEQAFKEEQSFLKAQAKEHNKTLKAAPEWYINPPTSNSTAIYGVGTAEADDLHMATIKSKIRAEFEAAKSFSQVVSGKEKSYLGDSLGGTSQTSSQVIEKVVAEADLSALTVAEQEVHSTGRGYRVYTLAKMDYQDAQTALGVRLRNQGNVQAMSDQAHAELQEDLERQRRPEF